MASSIILIVANLVPFGLLSMITINEFANLAKFLAASKIIQTAIAENMTNATGGANLTGSAQPTNQQPVPTTTTSNPQPPTNFNGTKYSFITKWGSPGTGDGQFNGTTGVAIDPKTGNVYVADFNNSRIQKFDSNGRFITKWGSLGTADGQFNGTLVVAVDPNTGNVYADDLYNNRIQKFDSNGNFIAKWGSPGTGDGQFNGTTGVAIDPKTGNVYVADFNNNRIQKFDSNGRFITKWGSLGKSDGQFNDTTGVAIDPKTGNVYVSDVGNNRIQLFSLQQPVPTTTSNPQPPAITAYNYFLYSSTN
jgi:DNA-binding beta-propeller fold protein YncE